MRTRTSLALVLATAVAALAARAHAAELRFTVTYRSAASVYLDGGEAAGLAVGDRLRVLAGGAPVAEIEVVYLAERSASCRIVEETRPVAVGDVAVISKELPPAPDELTVVPAAPGVEVTRPAPAPLAPAGERAAPWARVRGGVSVGWQRTWDETDAGFDFEQRTLRLDLSVRDLGGRPYRFDARLRGRQDLRLWSPSVEDAPRDERRDRVYALALSYEPPDGRVRWSAGRLGSSAVAVGSLDGALAELRVAGPVRLGGFFGNRTESSSDGLAESGRKYGGFLRLAPAGGAGSWDALLLGARETAGPDVSREYLAFQGRLARGGFSSYQWAELDVNRDWRESLAERNVQLSNLSVSGAYRVSASASLGVSYDLRRNYRTAETRSIPEALFDKFVRQGLRASVDVSPARGFGVRAFFGVRMREEAADDAYSYGGGVRHADLFGSAVVLSLEGSGFTNGVTKGVQGQARLARRFGSANADLAYGVTSYTLEATTGERRTRHFVRASGRGDLGRRMWLYGELEYDRGDDLQGPRVVVEVGYRF